jgi:glycine/D-amino acid oxidase-like deaminating enzyme
MDRRTLLKTGSLALAGFGAGCVTRSAVRTPASRNSARRIPVNLARVQVSLDRVIRTTVGLRPHRDSGFVLKADKLDAKTIIHNYGHGGAGMSLAWGTGAMAADMALAQGERRAAVLGCGSPGLTAARQLQRRGFDVTIYAMAVPPDTTSNMSTAGFTPTSGLVSADRRTPEWDAQFRQAAEISYRQLQLLAGRDYGVYWMNSYNATDDPTPSQGGGNDGDLLPEHLRPNREREILGPGEHPFPTRYAVRTLALSIEPSIYLDALVRDFLRFGGRIVIRKFDTPRDLMSLGEPVIVNATGLGSKTLFNDEELVPVKGQLSVLVPQPEVDYRASGPVRNVRNVTGDQRGGNPSINPRSDGIVVGNLMDRGNWSLEPDSEVRRRNVEAAAQFFAAMRPPIEGARLTRFEPPQAAPRLESFFDEES